ncbi:MAG: squalene/phytoene synthase family protein [Hyphomicrobiales bacterium]|nr:squalene/phytoene synthase family protein [Hyphomicrobiales bacterium]
MSEAYLFCQSLVYRADKDRFFASLFAAAESRPHLYALYGFNAEIARVRELVSDPFPGEMRYQWWRDALSGSGHGDIDAHPLASALVITKQRYELPVELFDAVLEARSFDLYEEPMAGLDELEAYGRDTSAAIIRLAAHILTGRPQPELEKVCCHAGIAFALTGLLRALPVHSGRRQLYLPADRLADHGIDPEEVFAGTVTPNLLALLAELRGVIRSHISETRKMICDVPVAAAPAFLPISLIECYLKEMERPGYDPFRSIVVVPQWRRQWLLWRSARKAAKASERAA